MFSFIVFLKEENKLWKLSREDKNHTMLGKKKKQMEWEKKNKSSKPLVYFFFQLPRFQQRPL